MDTCRIDPAFAGLGWPQPLATETPVNELTRQMKSISMGHACAVAGLADARVQLEIAREVLARDLSVRETEALVKRRTEPPRPHRSRLLPTCTRAPAEDRLKLALGTRVRIVISCYTDRFRTRPAFETPCSPPSPPGSSYPGEAGILNEASSAGRNMGETDAGNRVSGSGESCRRRF